MSEDGRAVVEEYWRRLESGDIPGAMHLMAPDVSYRLTGRTPISGTYHGMAELTERLMRPVFSRIQGLALVPDEIIGDGDRVVVLAHGSAKTPSGTDYANEYVFVYRVREGRIVSVAEYLDTVEVETKMFGKEIR